MKPRALHTSCGAMINSYCRGKYEALAVIFYYIHITISFDFFPRPISYIYVHTLTSKCQRFSDRTMVQISIRICLITSKGKNCNTFVVVSVIGTQRTQT